MIAARSNGVLMPFLDFGAESKYHIESCSEDLLRISLDLMATSEGFEANI